MTDRTFDAEDDARNGDQDDARDDARNDAKEKDAMTDTTNDTDKNDETTDETVATESNETAATETTADETAPVEFSITFDDETTADDVVDDIVDLQPAVTDESDADATADDSDDTDDTDDGSTDDETVDDGNADDGAAPVPAETSRDATEANARRVDETIALAGKSLAGGDAVDPNEVKAAAQKKSKNYGSAGDRVLLRAYPTFSLNHATTTNHKTGRHVLDDVSMAFYAGSMYAIRVLDDADDPEQRPTLMAVLGGFQLPTSGTAMTKSANLAELEINELRGHRLGLVPQRFAVRGDLDAESNVLYAMNASGRTFLKPKPVYAREMLERVGFGKATSGLKLRELPAVEQRRVAIARALSCEAETVILDEPTKGLNEEESAEILELLKSIAHSRDPKRAVIVVTASEEVVEAADKVFALEN